ncbi:MAG: hypothetical protein HOJ54_11040 [Phycisphaerae bacterium]|nr:hypothetical protein [Phycisphaerae bacterium]
MTVVALASMGNETQEFVMYTTQTSSRRNHIGQTVALAAMCIAAGLTGGHASGSSAKAGRIHRIPGIPGTTVTSIGTPGGGGVGPIIFGGGGTYGGPGDTVPPGPGNHHIGMCTMNFPPNVCDSGPACNLGWEWTPDEPRCEWPAFLPSTTEPLYAQGFKLTAGDVLEMLDQGTACVDAYGNITACIQAPFDVHEVHVFQSGWTNGYNQNAAINNAVSTTVCVDGDLLMSGWPFEEVAQARPCDYPIVCISFNAECIAQALQDWAASGTNLDEWSDAWLFYVDFVSCTPCD